MKRKWFLVVAMVLAVGMLLSFSLAGCKTAATETAAATTAAAETAAATTAAVTTAAAEKELVIGFIAINRQFEWLTYALKSAQEAADAAGVKMTVYDAENKAEKQGSLMEDLIAQKVDAIITDPISVESLNPFMVKAEAAGIPVATFDRRAEGAPYFAFIGCDDVLGGTLDAKFIADALGGKGDIVVLVGQLGAGPTIDRGNGFDTELKNYPDLKVVFSQTAKYEREEALKVMEDAITKTGGKFDAVYAMDDSMLMGALQAMDDAGLDQSKIVTVGYGGFPDALMAIRDGKVDATTTYPVAMAGAIVNVVVDYLKNGTVPEKKDDKIDPWIITKDNLETGDFYDLMK